MSATAQVLETIASASGDVIAEIAGSVAHLTALSEADRQASLGQIHAEAERAARESMGEEAYRQYLNTDLGRWLNLIPTWTNGVVFRD